MARVDDLTLFGAVKRSQVARRGVEATIKQAREDGTLPQGDCIEVSMLRQAADRLDHVRGDTSTKATYAEVPAERVLMEMLASFGLIGAREADGVDRLLAAMEAGADGS